MGQSTGGGIGLLAAVAFTVLAVTADRKVWGFVDNGALVLTQAGDLKWTAIPAAPPARSPHRRPPSSGTCRPGLVGQFPSEDGAQLVVWALWGRVVVDDMQTFRRRLAQRNWTPSTGRRPTTSTGRRWSPTQSS